MASDETFAQIVADVRTETNEGRLPRPGSGTYFVRVGREGAAAAATNTATDTASVSPAARTHFSAPQRIEVKQYVRDAQASP
ncbi:hypothetical protein ACU4GD_34635 [Cupriavidus basilensis]